MLVVNNVVSFWLAVRLCLDSVKFVSLPAAFCTQMSAPVCVPCQFVRLSEASVLCMSICQAE